MQYEKALLDPASAFLRPFDVLEVVSLTREQKLKILRQWEYDARELELADEEGMQSGSHPGPNSLLVDVHKALHKLKAEPNPDYI